MNQFHNTELSSCNSCYPSQPPGIQFRKELISSLLDSSKHYFSIILILMIQSRHNFAHVTTAQLWPEWLIIFHVRATCIFLKYLSCVHKLLVEWVPTLPPVIALHLSPLSILIKTANQSYSWNRCIILYRCVLYLCVWLRCIILLIYVFYILCVARRWITS